MSSQPPSNPLQVPPTAKITDRRLNPYRRPNRPAAERLVAQIAEEVDGRLPRKRKRRAVDQATFEATASAVISDLIFHSLDGGTDGVSVSRSNVWPPARYRSPLHTKPLPRLLDALAQDGLGYVEQTKGERTFDGSGSFLTRLVPTSRLAAVVTAAGVSSDEFAIVPGGEVIHLQAPKLGDSPANLIDYVETEETTRLRAEMTKINGQLATASLSVDEGELGTDDAFPELSSRFLIRRFTQGGFGTGGRLWGGFWQTMQRDLRRRALLIDDEPAVELDFGQAGARILYGMARAPVPDHDLYAVPGFEKHRDGIKQLMSAMSFSSQRLVRMPADVKSGFTKAHTAAVVSRAVEDFHRPIAHLFFHGVGHEAQRVESNIMVETLLRLTELGITALPIHDAVIVSRSAVQIAGQTMLMVFREIARVEGRLSSHPADALSPSR